MEDVRVCKRCRKLFTYYSNEYCNACQDEMEEIFVKVRDYIYDHPNHNIAEISQGTETKETDIMYLLRQGRISFSNLEGSCLACEKCGRSIISGRLCDSCKENLGKAMDAMLIKDAEREAARKDSKNKGYTSLRDVVK